MPQGTKTDEPELLYKTISHRNVLEVDAVAVDRELLEYDLHWHPDDAESCAENK